MPELVTLGETMAVFAPVIPEPLEYSTDYRARIAGAESNLAIGVRKLGIPAGWISRLGDDGFGRFILSRIRAEGVDTSRVTVDGRHRSGVMFKEPRYAGETRVYYYRDGSAASCLCPEDIPSDYIASARILHLTGITPVLSESCRQAVMKAVEIARKNNVMISFDPNIRLKLWGERDFTGTILEILRQADIVLIGAGEAERLLGTRDIGELFSRLEDGGRVSCIAVKNGAEGAWVGTKEGAFRIPPIRLRCVDAIGAGDAFNAGFIAGILEGRPVEICGRMGSIMGGLATQTLGDIEGFPTREEMRSYLTDTPLISR